MEAVFIVTPGHNVLFDRKFVSPVVSPGCLKMGKLLITRDDCNHYSRYSDTISLRTADDISEF